MTKSKLTLALDIDSHDIAYVAGLFDGEGCVNVTEVKPKKGRHSPSFQTLAQISNNDREVLNWVQSLFGGTITSNNVRRQRVTFTWRVYHKRAKEFLEIIFPYLRIKEQQAQLLIELENSIGRRGWKPRLSEEVIVYRRSIKEDLTKLNGPYLHSKYLEEVTSV